MHVTSASIIIISEVHVMIKARRTSRRRLTRESTQVKVIVCFMQKKVNRISCNERTRTSTQVSTREISICTSRLRSIIKQ